MTAPISRSGSLVGIAMPKLSILVSFAVMALLPTPVWAREVFAGIYAHGVDTPFSMDTEESGADLQVGYRFAPLESLDFLGKPAPYFIASINSKGNTSFAGAGLSWKLGSGPVYVRPELGIVLHDGPSRKITETGRHVGLGSRVLFEPGVSIGVQVSDRLAIEASWIHLSHGQLCDPQQNPGLDMWGARVNLKL